MLEVCSICLEGPGSGQTLQCQWSSPPKPACQQIHWPVTGPTIKRLEIQEMLQMLILGAEAILQGKPGHWMAVSREDFCFLGGREKRLSLYFPLIEGSGLLSFLESPSSKGYAGMRPLKENPPLPRRRQRQIMGRNKVRVKNMLLLSSPSYSLEKKVWEATDKDSRRSYDALGQADFSSDSRKVYKPRRWEIQEPNFIAEWKTTPKTLKKTTRSETPQ